MEQCQMEHLVLSDPLIRTYAKFKLTFVNDMYRKVACILDDHPIEELPFADGNFDLTVMINVLDHVRDAQECMRQLTRVTKPGGIVIVGNRRHGRHGRRNRTSHQTRRRLVQPASHRSFRADPP